MAAGYIFLFGLTSRFASRTVRVIIYIYGSFKCTKEKKNALNSKAVSTAEIFPVHLRTGLPGSQAALPSLLGRLEKALCWLCEWMDEICKQYSLERCYNEGVRLHIATHVVT